MIRRQLQHRFAPGKENPDKDTHGLALGDDVPVDRRAPALVSLQGDGPGDVETLPGLDGADGLRPGGAAVVAQVQAEGQKALVVHGGGGVPEQGDVGPLAGQDALGRLEKALLEGTVGKGQSHVHQIAGAAAGGVLDAAQGLTDDPFDESAGELAVHNGTSFPMPGRAECS